MREQLQKMLKRDKVITKKEISRLVHLIDYSFSLDKDWEGFSKIFEQVHRGFFVNLKECFPTLTKNGLRLCALLRINLSSKEIATILGISPNSVRIARYRLRKKLEMENEQSLLDFLMGIKDKE